MEEQSASATTSPSPNTESSDDLARLKAKLELVTADKHRAGETNTRLNQRIQELEESLRTVQGQLKSGETAQLEQSGEYKRLWEDAKATNTELENQLREVRQELAAERQARSTESLRARAIQEITAAEALRPDQLLALISSDLREVDGRPAIINGGIEIPLSDHLARLKSPDSGWEHHFRPTGAKGMGSAATAPVAGTAPAQNPFSASPPNLTEISRLYREDRALHDRLKAEAGR